MRFAYLLLPLVALAGCSSENVGQTSEAPVHAAMETETTTDSQDTTVAFNTAGAPTCELAVPGMMCEHGCGATVQKVLTDRPGVKEVKIDFPAKMAVVAVDDGEFDAEAAATLLESEYGFADTSVKQSDDAAAEPQAEAASSEQTAG